MLIHRPGGSKHVQTPTQSGVTRHFVTRAVGSILLGARGIFIFFALDRDLISLLVRSTLVGKHNANVTDKAVILTPQFLSPGVAPLGGVNQCCCLWTCLRDEKCGDRH